MHAVLYLLENKPIYLKSNTSWCHFNERQPCLAFHSVSVCWHVARMSTLVHMSTIHVVANAVELSNAQKRMNDRLMKCKQLHPVNCATRSALFRKQTLDVFCPNYSFSEAVMTATTRNRFSRRTKEWEFIESKVDCPVLEQYFNVISVCYLQYSNNQIRTIVMLLVL